MIKGDFWYDIDDNKYEVTEVTEDVREDGSRVKNISSKKVS